MNQKERINVPPMSDEEIIALYWNRDEKAILETDRKYNRYLYTVAYNILHAPLDCEECLNDTYLGTWNSIPPAKPSSFQVFISKIMRNIAISRYKKNHAARRVPSELTVSISELSEYVVYNENAMQYDYEVGILARLIDMYLHSLSAKRRFIFICRFYCGDRIADIAEMLHVTERTVFRELTRIKAGLKEVLMREGYYHE